MGGRGAEGGDGVAKEGQGGGKGGRERRGITEGGRGGSGRIRTGREGGEAKGDGAKGGGREVREKEGGQGFRGGDVVHRECKSEAEAGALLSPFSFTDCAARKLFVKLLICWVVMDSAAARTFLPTSCWRHCL